MDAQRFVDAQAGVIDAVRAELTAGTKRSHWMWFVFPQLGSLGRSATAKHYGLDAIDDARAWLDHPVLGPRLPECTALALRHADRGARAVFGTPDDLKFRSCMTLFALAAPDDPLFREALQRFFGGAGDPLTLAACGGRDKKSPGSAGA